ncbi:sulfotransferase [Winogradskyella echinorum]|uniref:Sulfotransferase n=1 Tax=Winogradskyella echinorum TaxID=538189 RepID=A0ABR6XZ00_9FLAO|nr:sulfotransferase [Winogradskyella echinorum]MBC3845739.1 sulfotransferase [Winogradskyella echinorum]MBC5750087.1 sulfotransferase [Winogradskyella echinorum]
MRSPIFIFSLPRSGSTLLQRILLSHKSIGGTSEPWLLLPLVYSIKEQGGLSEYSNKLSNKGIIDLLSTLPNGNEIYYNEIRNFSTNIYSKFLKEDEVYFLDKTPRYYYIIDDLYKIFPNAKFIFLFRNPIQVYASILTTWCNNNFSKLYGSHNDLYYGFKKLSESYQKYGQKKNTFKVNYSDLVNNPLETIKSIQDFLGIEYNKDLEYNFVNTKIDTEKYLGDPTGIKKYSSITPETLSKWKTVFNSNVRKWILRKYIDKSLTDEDLKTQGFDKAQLLLELNQLKTKGKHNAIKDLFSFFIYKTIIRFNLYLFFSKSTSWIKKTFIS